MAPTALAAVASSEACAAARSSGATSAPCRMEDEEGEAEDDGEEWKLAICVRGDLGMSTGKVAAQVGHAVHSAVVAATPAALRRWEADGSKKAVLLAKDAEHLQALELEAQHQGLFSEIIVDDGRTELDGPTPTVLAVGPASESTVNAVTGRLRLLPDPVEGLAKENQKLKERIGKLEKQLSATRLELYKKSQEESRP